jgi:hypothetical protein
MKGRCEGEARGNLNHVRVLQACPWVSKKEFPPPKADSSFDKFGIPGFCLIIIIIIFEYLQKKSFKDSHVLSTS